MGQPQTQPEEQPKEQPKERVPTRPQESVSLSTDTEPIQEPVQFKTSPTGFELGTRLQTQFEPTDRLTRNPREESMHRRMGGLSERSERDTSTDESELERQRIHWKYSEFEPRKKTKEREYR